MGGGGHSSVAHVNHNYIVLTVIGHCLSFIFNI